jgi:hypothetical protein
VFLAQRKPLLTWPSGMELHRQKKKTDKLQETHWQDMSNKHLLALKEEYIRRGTGVKSSDSLAYENVYHEGHISGF